MNTQNVIVAAAAGVIAGAVIGLLTAPASGAETRKKISDSASKVAEKIRRMAGKAANELDELKDIVQNQTEGLTEDTRNRILKLIAASKASYNHVAEEAMA